MTAEAIRRSQLHEKPTMSQPKQMGILRCAPAGKNSLSIMMPHSRTERRRNGKLIGSIKCLLTNTSARANIKIEFSYLSTSSVFSVTSVGNGVQTFEVRNLASAPPVLHRNCTESNTSEVHDLKLKGHFKGRNRAAEHILVLEVFSLRYKLWGRHKSQNPDKFSSSS